MGYRKKRIRRRRKLWNWRFSRKTKRAFGVGLILSIITLGVLLLNSPYGVIKDISKEGKSLRQIMNALIETRSGVFISINKSLERNVTWGMRYETYVADLELNSDVNLRKFWWGMKDALPDKYTVTEHFLQDATSRHLYTRIKYKKLALYKVILHQIIARKKVVETTAPLPSPVIPLPPQVTKPIELPPLPLPLPPKVVLPKGPKIAFVIDDVGYTKKNQDLFFSLPPEVTPAILPQIAYSTYFAREAQKRGFDVMLHLPLEPDNFNVNPGAGTIYSTMSEQEIRAMFLADLDSVPGCVGMNKDRKSTRLNSSHDDL
jgi:hypothetical protein